MNKSKYQVGDQVNNWQIIHVYYADWLNTWVYGVELRNGRNKLTCTENTIDRMIKTA